MRKQNVTAGLSVFYIDTDDDSDIKQNSIFQLGFLLVISRLIMSLTSIFVNILPFIYVV